MKKLAILVLFLEMASMAMGEVSTTVCLADGNTPLLPLEPNVPHVYPDIMVGTQLTIIVSSDVAEYWSGTLAIADANMDYGVLSCRGYNEITYDCADSRFPPAGREARVWPWEEPGINGFDLYTGSTGIEEGDWFIIDYAATSIGTCLVGFYDHSKDWERPYCYLEFFHVPTRDFNDDGIVNFDDFAILASFWQVVDGNALNWYEAVDLDTNGCIDFNDLMLFADFWLERTR